MVCLDEEFLIRNGFSPEEIANLIVYYPWSVIKFSELAKSRQDLLISQLKEFLPTLVPQEFEVLDDDREDNGLDLAVLTLVVVVTVLTCMSTIVILYQHWIKRNRGGDMEMGLDLKHVGPILERPIPIPDLGMLHEFFPKVPNTLLPSSDPASAVNTTPKDEVNKLVRSGIVKRSINFGGNRRNRQRIGRGRISR